MNREECEAVVGAEDISKIQRSIGASKLDTTPEVRPAINSPWQRSPISTAAVVSKEWSTSEEAARPAPSASNEQLSTCNGATPAALSNGATAADGGLTTSPCDPQYQHAVSSHSLDGPSLEHSNICLTPQRDTRLYVEHLRVCNECREHEIKMYEAEISRLEGLGSSEPPPETSPKPEIKLTKIPAGAYRRLNNWQHDETRDGTILLLTIDGAEFGIRRSHDFEQVPTELDAAAPHPENAKNPASDEIPFRLIFKSTDLLLMLEKITDEELPADRPVHVRPFKYLLAHENRIRAALKDLQAAYVSTQAKPDGDGTPQSKQNGVVPMVHPSVTPDDKILGVEVTEHNVRLLECLVQFVDVEMEDIRCVKEEVASGTLTHISFEYVQHLFRPGDLVFTRPASHHQQHEARRAYRVLFVTGGRPQFESYREQKEQKYVSIYDKDRGVDIGGIEVFPEDIISQGLQGKATKMTPLVLDCFYIDFDGYSYGPRSQRFIVPEFSGTKRITELDVYPANFDPDCEKVRHALRRRGKDFVEYAHGTHMEYHGRTLADSTRMPQGLKRDYTAYYYPEQAPKLEITQVDSECIVDQQAAMDRFAPTQKDGQQGFTNSNKLGFQSGVIAKPSNPHPAETSDRGPEDATKTEIYDDSAFDLSLRSALLRRTPLLTVSKDIDEEQLELLPLRLFGYALQSRKWYAFNVLNLSRPVTLQDTDTPNAFDDLVLPEKHKKSIQALVSHQVRGFRVQSTTGGDSYDTAKGSSTFDLIHGKGRGLIILLHGPPGVGKTSTAESVAIQLKRPLLAITCGDLGTDSATDIENNLESFFELGAKWGCVILLDEADVFLARRVTGDVKRNSLVSVFLRQMEYYSGVLILTTNRVGEFDEAFVSRIHMKLHFPTLKRIPTMQIWDMNIRRIKRTDLNIDVKAKGIRKFAEEYWEKNEDEKLAGRQWNGRQIKNAFQTAVALAYWEHEAEKAQGRDRGRPVLRKSHFEDVAKTSLHFDDYMDKVYGALMPNGRRSKGAYTREMEKMRLRYDDNSDEEVERAEQRYPLPQRGAPPMAKARQQVSAESARLAELERKLAAFENAQTAPVSRTTEVSNKAGKEDDDNNEDEEDSSSDDE